MEALNTNELKDLRNELERIKEEPQIDDLYKYKNEVYDQMIVKEVFLYYIIAKSN